MLGGKRYEKTTNIVCVLTNHTYMCTFYIVHHKGEFAIYKISIPGIRCFEELVINVGVDGPVVFYRLVLLFTPQILSWYHMFCVLGFGKTRSLSGSQRWSSERKLAANSCSGNATTLATTSSSSSSWKSSSSPKSSSRPWLSSAISKCSLSLLFGDQMMAGQVDVSLFVDWLSL